MEPRRRFRLSLAAACLLGLVLQGLMRWREWGTNPLARVPLDDAEVYWRWAGAIAGGRLVGDTPFLSAPLYPYLLGLLRALGLGLPGVIAVQAVLHAATAWLVGVAARRHFAGAGTAAVAAAILFLLLADPSYAAGRLLGASLQLFLVAALWCALQVAAARDRARDDLALGALLGLNALANPALLAAFPLVAAWRWGRRPGGFGRGARVLAAAVLVVAPATLHNRLACGEWIPISAQAGVTFAHGNAHGAGGGYHPIPGISSGRLKQNEDAFRVAAEATGTPSWSGASSWFFRRGLAWWASEPGAAVTLALRKAGLFFAGHAYGDVALPPLERAAGLKPWNGLVPVPLVLAPAALVLAASWRRRRAGFAESLLLLAPLAVVVLFFYSPRYRMPALPVAAVLAVEAFLPAAGGRRRHALGVAGLVLGTAALFAGPRLEPAPADLRPAFEQKLGEAFEREGRFEEAAARFREADRLGYPDAGASLGLALRRLGRNEEGIDVLRRAARAQPERAFARRALGTALAQDGAWPEAEAEFRAAIALDPADWEASTSLANVLRETGRPAGEIETLLDAALRVRPDHAPAWHALGLLQRREARPAEAAAAFVEALRADPAWLPALLELAELHAGADGPEAAAPARARALAEDALARLRAAPAAVPLDVVRALLALARAEAALGAMAAAADAAEQALAVARTTGAPAELVGRLRALAASLRDGQPFPPGFALD